MQPCDHLYRTPHDRRSHRLVVNARFQLSVWESVQSWLTNKHNIASKRTRQDCLPAISLQSNKCKLPFFSPNLSPCLMLIQSSSRKGSCSPVACGMREGRRGNPNCTHANTQVFVYPFSIFILHLSCPGILAPDGRLIQHTLLWDREGRAQEPGAAAPSPA